MKKKIGGKVYKIIVAREMQFCKTRQDHEIVTLDTHYRCLYLYALGDKQEK